MMTIYLKWKKEMETGNKKIDSQHKKLFEQVKLLSSNISRFKTIGSVRQNIDFLIKYSKEHFETEEQYMKKHRFPGLQRHKKIHRDFNKFVKKFINKFNTIYSSKNITYTDLLELSNHCRKYLGDWLINHLIEEDQKYVRYIAKHKKSTA